MTDQIIAEESKAGGGLSDAEIIGIAVGAALGAVAAALCEYLCVSCIGLLFSILLNLAQTASTQCIPTLPSMRISDVTDPRMFSFLSKGLLVIS